MKGIGPYPSGRNKREPLPHTPWRKRGDELQGTGENCVQRENNVRQTKIQRNRGGDPPRD